MKRPNITDKMKLEVLGRYSAPCWHCVFPVIISEMQYDHTAALVDGGAHATENIKLICRLCHSKKSAFEHKRNSKSKRIAKAREVHTAVVRKEAARAPSKIKSRGFPKLPKAWGVVR